MSFEARIIADSVNTSTGDRLVTSLLTRASSTQRS